MTPRGLPGKGSLNERMAEQCSKPPRARFCSGCAVYLIKEMPLFLTPPSRVLCQDVAQKVSLCRVSLHPATVVVGGGGGRGCVLLLRVSSFVVSPL